MSRYSAAPDEARDIYQQVIIILYENVVSGRLTNLTSSLKTYLFSIGKNKFLEEKRKGHSFPLVELPDNEKKMDWDERLGQLEQCLSQLGEPCRSLLIQFYYHKSSMEQLSLKFGYKNVQSAKNQKYKCLERLRKMVLLLPPVESKVDL